MNRSTILERSDAQAARGFHALADPARLAILSRLAGGTWCVCELEADLGLAPSLLSYHIRILREAGLVRGSRNGRRTEYRLVPDGLHALRLEMERLASSGVGEP